VPDPRVIVKALIQLNRLENEFRMVSERSKRKGETLALIEILRGQIPVPILTHHNRIRARGRNSTSPVRDWVCRTCFISVASGLRTHLIQRDDLYVCENCGSYSYIPDSSKEYPDDTQLSEEARVLALKAEKPDRAGKVAKAAKAAKVKVEVVVKVVKKAAVKTGIKIKKAVKRAGVRTAPKRLRK